MARAEAVFEKFALFGQKPTNPIKTDLGIKGKQVEKLDPAAKSIKPLNSVWLDKKERQKQRELDAGKAWGSMPKVELTEQLRNDLKAIQFRNQIFAKKFYKKNDSEKLPQYFQIATVIDDGIGYRKNGKKVKASSIADQFLREDESTGFSKRKYERINDKRRRMGDKKAKIKKNKEKRALVKQQKRGGKDKAKR